MKLTGERPMQGATPDSLLAFHDAGYREVVARLGPGTVVDVGCGVGEETLRLAAPDRFLVGVDYSSDTVRAAARSHGGVPGVGFCASDGAALALRDGSTDFVVSSHIIEHFTNPVAHVAELARVLRADGTAFVVTPNAPADFENPFHVYLFERAQLVSMLSLFFEDVTCLGLEGDDALHADFAARRASGERLLRLDALGLRHRLPRRTYVWAYEHVLPLVYRMLGDARTGIGSGLSERDFFVTEHVDDRTPGLFAIARRPRRKESAR
jgi:ubiquinone/menaquinone biosynthesis C-methylase UbiE